MFLYFDFNFVSDDAEDLDSEELELSLGFSDDLLLPLVFDFDFGSGPGIQ